jgi:HD-like signal output (HDOD) protein
MHVSGRGTSHYAPWSSTRPRDTQSLVVLCLIDNSGKKLRSKADCARPAKGKGYRALKLGLIRPKTDTHETYLMPFITTRLPSLQLWTSRFALEAIPVLPETVTVLAELAERIDELAPRDIAAAIRADPLMSLKTLVWASEALNKRRSSDLRGEPETVEETLVMMGVYPFFNRFGSLTDATTHLQDIPGAYEGLREVVDRAQQAAIFAVTWAAYRQDLDATVIQEAALLHDIAEMMVWCVGPNLGLAMKKIRQLQPSMRSLEIQQRVLGVSLSDLTLAVLEKWRLPSMLARLNDPTQHGLAAVQNVLLSVNLARHAANGWDDPALHDDYIAIGRLLNRSGGWVQAEVQRLAGHDTDATV